MVIRACAAGGYRAMKARQTITEGCRRPRHTTRAAIVIDRVTFQKSHRHLGL